ncbi:MSCRAMM family protein [Streptomyces sp. NBC_01236]|uniref:MSCRAMM family protein n=1 Tax=Streptomyces sp. NBC_01236 TaxID=2903789 RepID=UPI002E0D24F2|nr:prealbumin-like fold domain-containing protein [Streptomyces sp. NBC_01236]
MYVEKTAANRNFLNSFWTRVQEPQGSTNMNFEFNQSQTTSSNGTTKIRTANDLLVQYDLEQGGVSPSISVRRWTGSQWGPATDLSSASDATAGINITAITSANSDGLGALSARTFGEAQLDLDELLGSSTTCTSFGSAYLKSRSSAQFNSALKDFIAPQSVQISNCGGVKIIKQDDNGDALNGAEFTLFQNGNATTFKCTTANDGTCTINNVPTGDYVVHETKTPPGFDPAPDQSVHVTAGSTATVGPLTDTRQTGAINVTKVRKVADGGNNSTRPHTGVTFEVLGTGKSGTTQLDAMGNATVCFDGLPVGSSTRCTRPFPPATTGRATRRSP